MGLYAMLVKFLVDFHIAWIPKGQLIRTILADRQPGCRITHSIERFLECKLAFVFDLHVVFLDTWTDISFSGPV